MAGCVFPTVLLRQKCSTVATCRIRCQKTTKIGVVPRNTVPCSSFLTRSRAGHSATLCIRHTQLQGKNRALRSSPPPIISSGVPCASIRSTIHSVGRADVTTQLEKGDNSHVKGTECLLPPRGFRDFPPSTFAILKCIFSVWRRVSEEFGFQEYKGPSLERSVLYSRFVSPDSAETIFSSSCKSDGTCAKSEAPPHIYRLQSNGSEALCLRPELTPSLSRMLQREALHRPSRIARRWFSIERVWRHERPGLGRRREHFQWNLDIAFPAHLAKRQGARCCLSSEREDPQKTPSFTSDPCRPSSEAGLENISSYATAEIIAAAVRLFQLLGLTAADVRIRVGSRALLYDLLRTQQGVCMGSGCAAGAQGLQPTRTVDPSLPLPYSSVADKELFADRLVRTLKVLDRAGRRSLAQTITALSNSLGVTHKTSRSILERLHSFDVNNDAMVSDLAEGLGLHPLVDPLQESEWEPRVTSFEASQLPASVREMRFLLRLLDEGYGVADWIDVDLMTVRGLHYYTGLVFEAFDTDGSFRAIMGGGCYGEPRDHYTPTNEAPRVQARIAAEASESEAAITCAASLDSSDFVSDAVQKGERCVEGIVGVGLGMGDCVLLELLRKTGMLPTGRPTLDVVVVLKQVKTARRCRESAVKGATSHERKHFRKDLAARDITSFYQAPSISQAATAQALCASLRAKGFRVELLLPPQSSERASIRHAKFVGAKAVVFVTALSDSSRFLSNDDFGQSDLSRISGEQKSDYSMRTRAAFQVVFLENSKRSRALATKTSEPLVPSRVELPEAEQSFAADASAEQWVPLKAEAPSHIPSVVALLTERLALNGAQQSASPRSARPDVAVQKAP